MKWLLDLFALLMSKWLLDSVSLFSLNCSDNCLLFQHGYSMVIIRPEGLMFYDYLSNKQPISVKKKRSLLFDEIIKFFIC